MGRVRVQSYGNGKSKSARVLARALGVLRIKVTGSKFRGKNTDVIINWGKPKNIIANARYANPIDAVIKASNKRLTLETLDRAGLSIPKYYYSLEELPTDGRFVARTTLTGHSGRGIIVGTKDEVPNAPLYTEYIEKQAEYRVIVVNGKAVDIKVKKKKIEWEGERDEHIWNHKNGYVFVRNSGVFNSMLPSVGVAAVEALGLNYGAVDIIEDENDLYVLEVNTAFGLEGETIERVAKEMKCLIQDLM